MYCILQLGGTSGVNELETSRPKFARLNESDVPNTSSYCNSSVNGSEEEVLHQSMAWEEICIIHTQTHTHIQTLYILCNFMCFVGARS